MSRSVHTPPLSSWDKHPWYPLNRPGGPQSCCGQFVEVTNLLLLPEVRPQFHSCSLWPSCLPAVILTNYLFIEYILFHSPLPHSLGQMFLTLFLSVFYWCKVKFTAWSRYSSVGIVIRYGLDGPGIESWWGWDFPVQTSSEANLASYSVGTGSFLGVKRPKRGVDHPPHLAPRLMKEYCFTFCITNFVFCWATCISH